MTSRFFILVLLLTTQAIAQERPQPQPTPAQVLNVQGVSIEFNVAPIRTSETRSLLAGEEAQLGFKITSSNGSVPLSNLRPVAWIDQRPGKETSEPKVCREKVQAFLQASFSKRPTLDLNAYFVLTLNEEANISVLDPLSGFGGSKLYNLIALPDVGEDWVMSPDQSRLFVSMPAINQIAAIDMATWKLVAAVHAGARPNRVALQHDGRYLWVGNDTTGEAESGVTVIDTSTLKVAAQIATGAGHHEIAFSDDDRFAFVSNKQDGTLSVIDTRKLATVKNITIGQLPIAVAFSSLSKAIYVANEGDGTIAVVDVARLEILARIKAERGLRTLRLQPDGRFGFALNPVSNTAFVFDLPANKLVHKIPVGPDADQITFTRQFAYVRSSGSEFVNMIKLADLGKEAALSRFPAGQKAPSEVAARSLAAAIVPAPEEGAVLVANPADRMIYYYSEGMAAPMGSFQNYRRIPKALLVLDNGLRETSRGIYSTTIRLDTPGHYDAVFLLDAPRAVYCFDFTVDQNPAKPKHQIASLKARQLTTESPVVGETYKLRFKIEDEASKDTRNDLGEVRVLVYLAPGIWQERMAANELGDGVYEISFVPPRQGVYYVHFGIPSLNVPFSQIFPLALETKTAVAPEPNQ